MGRLSRKPAAKVDPRCIKGHVLVDDDLECLVCAALVTTDDRIGMHLHRDRGELDDTRNIATGDSW